MNRLLRLALLLPLAVAQFVVVFAFLAVLCVLAAAWVAFINTRAALNEPIISAFYTRPGFAALERHLAEEAQS